MGHVTAENVALDGPLPPEFCKSRWRELLIALVLTAAFVLVASFKTFTDMTIDGRAVAGNVPPVSFPTQPAVAPAGAILPVARQVAAPIAGWFTTPTTTQSAPTEDPNVRLVRGSGRSTFNRVAEDLRPTVVGLRTSIGTTGQSGRVGSGVVVDRRGYAVTCRHVVADASTVVASRFRAPQRWLPSRVVATADDLALIHIADQAPFVSATLGDSSQALVGDWVLALGHPFGLGLTVTAGIIGNRHGRLVMPGGRLQTGLIQTDAPINEGSSGGPLVDEAGRVVGINTAIYAPTGVFSGAGFAIPSDVVRQFLAQALPDAEALRAPPEAQASAPAWGVGLVALTPDLAAQIDYSGSGVLVSSVELNSPADTAQLARGDVIVSIAGQRIANLDSVAAIREQLDAQQPVSLQIWRRGTTSTVTLWTQAGPSRG